MTIPHVGTTVQRPQIYSSLEKHLGSRIIGENSIGPIRNAFVVHGVQIKCSLVTQARWS